MFHWTIHNCTKFASSSRFKYNFNTLIFSLIGRELSELHEFYKMCPEMEIFRGVPSVLQTAVIINSDIQVLEHKFYIVPHTWLNGLNNSWMNSTVPEHYLCNICMLQRIFKLISGKYFLELF